MSNEDPPRTEAERAAWENLYDAHVGNPAPRRLCLLESQINLHVTDEDEQGFFECTIDHGIVHVGLKRLEEFERPKFKSRSANLAQAYALEWLAQSLRDAK